MEEEIKEILENHNVILGYLFGSYARGTAGPLSDIDIAVAFPFGLSAQSQEEKIGDIRKEIQSAFETNYVDVINLNKNHNILLGHRIIFGGKPLLIKNARLKQVLESKYLHEYENTRHLRADQFRILKNYYVSN